MADFADDLFDFCEDTPAAAPTKVKTKKQKGEKRDPAQNVR
jgi:hypothetical protein